MLFVFTLPHIKTEQNHCSVAQKPCSLFSSKTETKQKLSSVCIFLSWQPKSVLVLLISTPRYVRIKYKYGRVVQKSNSNIFRNLGHQGFQSRSWKSMVFKRIFFLKWWDSDTLRNLGNQGFQSRSWKSMVSKRIFFLKWWDSETLRNLGNQGFQSRSWKSMVFKSFFLMVTF